MSKSKKALVLGASGVVGVPLCQSLVDRGWQVYGAARFGDPDKAQALEQTGAEKVVFYLTQDDPGQLPDVDTLIMEVWDRHFHAADIGELDQAQPLWSLNFDAVARVASRYAGQADIVNGSTISLYGPRADRPSHETDAPTPTDQYGLSRLAQERMLNFLCDQSGSRVTHLRYARSNTVQFGTVRRMADTILTGESQGRYPDQRIQVIGLDDFVRCTVEAAERIDQMPRAVHVVHPTIWTLRGLAERLQRGMGKGEVVFETEAGGARTSVWADPALMIDTFGPPQQDLEQLINEVCKAAV